MSGFKKRQIAYLQTSGYHIGKIDSKIVIIRNCFMDEKS